MKLSLDTEAKTLITVENGETVEYPLYTKAAFEVLSRQWVRLGWNQKYPYIFSWMGRPVIQLPEDMIRTQEVIFSLKPDVILETGVAHGGSQIFYASLCEAMGHGRSIGIDIDIRPHNRVAIENHPLSKHITLIEGSSVSTEVLSEVDKQIKPEESVLVFLDSNHTYAHVRAELDAYSPYVTPGSYIVATDGIMFDLADVPRGKPDWVDDNPKRAALDFAAKNPTFKIEQPNWPFNESELDENITHWPSAWLKRIE